MLSILLVYVVEELALYLLEAINFLLHGGEQERRLRSSKLPQEPPSNPFTTFISSPTIQASSALEFTIPGLSLPIALPKCFSKELLNPAYVTIASHHAMQREDSGIAL